MAFNLKPKHAIGKRVALLLLREIDTALAALARGPLDDESIHSARRCGKRSRALLRLARPLLSEKRYRRENRCWRELGQRLSAARGATALGTSIDRLHALYPDRLSVKDAKVLHAQTTPIRSAALRSLRKEFVGVTADLSSARRRIAAWRKLRGWHRILQGVENGHLSAQRAFHEAVRNPDPGHRHEWRKRLKTLCYQAHLLRQVWPLMLQAWEGQMERLGDMLGEEHDLHLLRNYLHKLPANREAAKRADRIARSRIHCLRLQTKDLGEQLHAEPTAMLIARLRACRSASP